jgi:hypothetical protein
MFECAGSERQLEEFVSVRRHLWDGQWLLLAPSDHATFNEIQRLSFAITFSLLQKGESSHPPQTHLYGCPSENKK